LELDVIVGIGFGDVGENWQVLEEMTLGSWNKGVD